MTAFRKRTASKPDTKTPARSGADTAQPKSHAMWELRLYVAGQTPKSIAALTNLRKLCEAHMPGQYRIEVVDLLRSPHLAAGDQIVAIPTLVRKLPEPIRKIVGDLSNTERTLVGLQLRPVNHDEDADSRPRAV